MALPPAVADALTAAARAGSLVVATDFDGVLAPLVLDPSTSRPLPGTVESLRVLAGTPDTYAAVVSGRDLATLAALTGIEDGAVTLIGSHGAESSAEAADGGLDEEERETLERLTADLEQLRAQLPDVRLETKPSAVVAHTRGMDADAAAAAEQSVLEVAARHDGVRVMQGKHVVEMSVHDADKGTALTGLRDRVGADALVYFGDDVTDEDVFTRLADGDVGVKVGDGDTAAGWRVEEPQDVADALAMLADLRRSR
ncbi:trehalose-phosphatase [Phycicoccus sp. 3266]|uniref:trehalose-phosphatase n=1 Tax=Phycicoccus sp. 3266 TaxID=2817751 RepID=UPI002858EA58|nr:trehalose-phosphatase [Phycicoccus sp. 3266]MDR6862842.1 trehalose 6-phosphate phosphatase [Phycicoccus sp. 3266]